MELSLKGKVALITGSSRGIGLAIATKLLKAGAQIVLNGRNQDSLDLAASKLGNSCLAVATDVSQPESAKHLLDACLAKYSRLDILVCNVGGNIGKDIAPGTETYGDFQQGFLKNFYSATNMIEVCKSELAKNSGNIVCISSICGHEVIGAPTYYNCAKAALNMYIASNSRPFAKENIRINGVSPGNVLFEGSVWENKVKQNPLFVKDLLETQVPQKRFGSPEEIADAVLFLCSEQSRFITGEILKVDGGQTRSL